MTQGSFRIRWLGITFFQQKIPQEERKKEKRRERFDWKSIPEMGSLFTESYPYFTNVLNAFTKSISIKRLSFNVTIGLGSSADTAIVSGYLWSLASIVNVYPPIYLSVEPDFQEERLDGSMMIELKVRLLRIAVAFIKAFSKKPVRRLFSRMRG
ncbi:MAG: DUF2953 domain-containing protein [Nitrososphaerales archaeon]